MTLYIGMSVSLHFGMVFTSGHLYNPNNDTFNWLSASQYTSTWKAELGQGHEVDVLGDADILRDSGPLTAPGPSRATRSHH